MCCRRINVNCGSSCSAGSKTPRSYHWAAHAERTGYSRRGEVKSEDRKGLQLSARAESLRFVYRPLAEILVAEPLDTILQRVESTIGEPAKSPSVDAVGGKIEATVRSHPGRPYGSGQCRSQANQIVGMSHVQTFSRRAPRISRQAGEHVEHRPASTWLLP